jgi:hypothetical protein
MQSAQSRTTLNIRGIAVRAVQLSGLDDLIVQDGPLSARAQVYATVRLRESGTVSPAQVDLELCESDRAGFPFSKMLGPGGLKLSHPNI